MRNSVRHAPMPAARCEIARARRDSTGSPTAAHVRAIAAISRDTRPDRLECRLAGAEQPAQSTTAAEAPDWAQLMRESLDPPVPAPMSFADVVMAQMEAASAGRQEPAALLLMAPHRLEPASEENQ